MFGKVIDKYEDLTRDQIDRIIYMYTNRPCTMMEIAQSEEVTVDVIYEVLDKHYIY